LIAGSARVAIDPRCYAAAERLKSEFGISDVSPFSYIPDPSPLLNVKCEPAEWYTGGEVEKLGPLAFFGAIPDRSFARPRKYTARPHVFASFGTIIWRYWTREALDTYAAIADAIESLGAEGTISLGGAPVGDEAIARLQRPSVRVERYVDQWKTLEHSDLFVTHHGRGSTHEAVACGTPMLSHPFFWDQPSLALRAHELGVATPLLPGTTGQDAVPSISEVVAAIEHAFDRLPDSHASLLEAQTWERRAIEERPAFARKVLALA
jgi:UDP:flavonoid glycosyltransferase YjiC (YdhE family)